MYSYVALFDSRLTQSTAEQCNIHKHIHTYIHTIQISIGCGSSTLLRNVGWHQISAPRFQQHRENLKNFTVDVLGPRSQVVSLGPLLRDALFMLYSWQRQSPPAARRRSRICHLLLPYDVMYPNTGPTHTIRQALCQRTVDIQWLSIVFFQIWSLRDRIWSGYVSKAKFLTS